MSSSRFTSSSSTSSSSSSSEDNQTGRERFNSSVTTGMPSAGKTNTNSSSKGNTTIDNSTTSTNTNTSNRHESVSEFHDDGSGVGSSATNTNMKLRIKSSSSHVGIINRDTEIEIPNKGCPKTTSVAQLKALVWKAMLLRKEATTDNTEQQQQLLNRYGYGYEYEYLRLICKGRLLAPDDSPLSEFKVVDNDVVHAVLSKASATAATTIGTATTGKPVLLQPGSNCQQQQQRQQRQRQSLRSSSSSSSSSSAANNNNSNSSIPQLLQHQRRRRQHPNRGVGTIVGPGGRVTRDTNTNNGNNEDDNTGSSSSDDDNDNDESLGLELRTILTGTQTRTRSRTRRERRGFDLLRGPLSRQEITAIRTYFNRYVDRYVQQQQQQHQQSRDSNNNNSDSRNPNPSAAAAATTTPSTLHMDEPDLRRRRLLVEEEWMRIQGPTSEFRLNLNQNTLLRFPSLDENTGSLSFLRGGGNSSVINNSNSNIRASGVARPGHDRDFVWGFCLGFFVGVISLVWVWIPTVSHKKKLGILTGICFQLLLDSNASNNNSNSDYYDYTGEEDRFIFDNGGAGGRLRGTRLTGEKDGGG